MRVPQRKGGYGGERRGICPSPEKITVVERTEQKQERRNRTGPTDSLNLPCPTKHEKESVPIEILLYARHVPTTLLLSYNNPLQDNIPILHRRKQAQPR